MKIDGARLTGICSDGKAGVCCSDQRLFGIAKNSRAMNWFILSASLLCSRSEIQPEAAVVYSERDNNATTIEIAPNRV
jgi:hypothetical protein